MGSPAIEPDNPATRIFRQVQALNASEGRPAGRNYGGPISAEPPARVQSAAMRAEPIVLDPAEQARRDSIAREMGILPDDDNEPGTYTAEAALAASTPVRMPVRVDVHGRAIVGPPRLPDFQKVQVLDLVRGVAVVDGFEVSIPSIDLPWMRAYAIQLVVDLMTQRLAQALAEVGMTEQQLVQAQAPPAEKNESSDEAVQPVSRTPLSDGLHQGDEV